MLACCDSPPLLNISMQICLLEVTHMNAVYGFVPYACVSRGTLSGEFDSKNQNTGSPLLYFIIQLAYSNTVSCVESRGIGNRTDGVVSLRCIFDWESE